MTDILNETAPRVERKTINSIQFLRGAAALLVLVEHLRIESGLYPYGAVGVDLFFVISGFIIFFVTESDQRNFFLKRIIRIVPLYWLVTFAIAAITIAKPSLFNSASFGVAHFFWSLFFIPHYTEAQGLRPLLALGWTLNYEMMFYLLFAAGMAISHKWRFEITSLLLLGLFLIANALPIGPTHGFSFYGDAIILEFIFGMAIAKHLHRQPVTSRVAMLSLVTVTLALFLIVTIWRPTGVRIIDNGIPAAIMFVALLSSEALFSTSTTLQRISIVAGSVSYALYLIHIYFLGALSRLFDLTGWSLWIASLLVIPLAAWLTYRFVETPMTKWLRARLL